MNNNILEALNHIPVAELSYEEWLSVGMALKTEGYDCSIWDDWSRNDTRYKEGECPRKWATFVVVNQSLVRLSCKWLKTGALWLARLKETVV